eukprot:CAMPEP_0174370064 /NCGR_PEP_ID=MMETSP0811_2-20130205/94842_1 /TAXON_ID=73025 ORGANISM="Eutreptiella gymnastica-like, Strain CCMP1594" /NCGR_SAMPLE_ID=MMETSP0811_2 /ASSEMBLY_ACC=CAM_ASM_000667 /LENGTH=39 /DNA_ID= /DNA_START= /DNA_END= /DNA_ORIENTATION=
MVAILGGPDVAAGIVRRFVHVGNADRSISPAGATSSGTD